EQGVGVPLMCTLAALRPAHRQVHRRSSLALLSRVGRAFVKNHYYIGVQRALYTHRFLGRKKTDIAVYRRLETDPFFANLAQWSKTEYLEAARIRQYRLLPGHEAM